MAAKAIEVLSQDPDGFFLVIEGGAIDWMATNRNIPARVSRWMGTRYRGLRTTARDELRD